MRRLHRCPTHHGRLGDPGLLSKTGTSPFSKCTGSDAGLLGARTPEAWMKWRPALPATDFRREAGGAGGRDGRHAAPPLQGLLPRPLNPKP